MSVSAEIFMVDSQLDFSAGAVTHDEDYEGDDDFVDESDGEVAERIGVGKN